MSQYQRMVSYLYQYYQGEKGENVGYVRVERRQQQCRIVVKMRSLALEHMPEIRLFIQEPDGLVYVPAGNLSAGGNSLERQLVTMSENVFQSGKSIDNFEGLLLYVSAKTYFATSWKNDHIFLGDMRTFADNEAVMNTDGENADTSSNDTQGGTDSSQSPENTQPEQRGTADGTAKMQPTYGNPTEGTAKGQSAHGSLTESTAKGQTAFGRQADGNANRQTSHGNMAESIAETHTAYNQTADTASNNDRNDIHAAMVEGELTAAEENIVNMAATRSSQNKVSENNTKNQYNENEKIFDKDEVEMQSVCSVCPFKRKTVDYGKRMLYAFPHMHPFPDNRVRDCVRIEPQDIGCLPIRLWSLANNNFLLQGYFNYRHLLFLELKDGNYAVGVPGIFTQKESGTAQRFAFPQFMPLSSEENCNGAFGYWLQTLPRTLS